MCNRDIESSICREMSGDLEKGMLAVGRCRLSKFISGITLKLAEVVASVTPAKDHLLSNNSSFLLFMLSFL